MFFERWNFYLIRLKNGLIFFSLTHSSRTLLLVNLIFGRTRTRSFDTHLYIILCHISTLSLWALRQVRLSLWEIFRSTIYTLLHLFYVLIFTRESMFVTTHSSFLDIAKWDMSTMKCPERLIFLVFPVRCFNHPLFMNHHVLLYFLSPTYHITC